MTKTQCEIIGVRFKLPASGAIGEWPYGGRRGMQNFDVSRAVLGREWIQYRNRLELWLTPLGNHLKNWLMYGARARPALASMLFSGGFRPKSAVNKETNATITKTQICIGTTNFACTAGNGGLNQDVRFKSVSYIGRVGGR